jgi:hypothetical protein
MCLLYSSQPERGGEGGDRMGGHARSGGGGYLEELVLALFFPAAREFTEADVSKVFEPFKVRYLAHSSLSPDTSSLTPQPFKVGYLLAANA